MSIEHWALIVTVLTLVVTVVLAAATVSLAKSTVQMVNEMREGSVRQLGVQTWLQLTAHFDSQEIRTARGELAKRLESGYDSANTTKSRKRCWICLRT
jgi:hypothetical protein